ncbi:MAG: PINc/VapC family ATPase [Candidatus Aenigmatarchaeota archaeon]
MKKSKNGSVPAVKVSEENVAAEKKATNDDLRKKIVPDTSVLIQGKISELIEKNELKGIRLIVPRAVIDELQAQASRSRDIGFKGLEELKTLRKLATEGKLEIEFTGQRPTLEEIQLAKKGRIDALIRDVAAKVGGVLMTGDYVQALVAEAEGVSVELIRKPVLREVSIEGFFTSDTQSVHMKVGVKPVAKKGKPGEVQLVQIRDKPVNQDEIDTIIAEIMDKVRVDENSFVEISRMGAVVVQMGEYRIAITRPPFSDAMELTAVRPIAKLSMDDYRLHEQLERSILENSKGILISGPPGSGKTSFASALANFLQQKGKIVKTFEQPRDLQVVPEVTQYAPLERSWENTAEMLLLVRPDYTIFDEIRNTKDFKIFADMRLAGVGMVGVVHATTPVSAIQRFVGRVELGVIPHVIDTVIYINAGRIEKVFTLELTVRVPTGMKEEDLTRPVIDIRDYETKALEFEVYTFGEENVIIPIKKQEDSPLRQLAKQKIMEQMRKYDPQAKVDFVNDGRVIALVRNDCISKLIGKKGQNIQELENRLGIRISVEPKEATLKGGIQWSYEETGAFLNIAVPEHLVGQKVDLYRRDDYLMSAHVGKQGYISIKKKTPVGRKLLGAVASDELQVKA